MKRYLLLLLAIAGLTQAATIFSGVTANQNTSVTASQYAPPFSPGDQQANLYASGPLSGTWTATVHFYAAQNGNSELRLLATMSLTNAGPNTDGTGTKAYDNLGINVKGGTSIYADVTNVTGTIPAPGLFAENK